VLAQPVAVALDVDHLAVMQQPVQDGRCDHRVSEQLLPIAKTLVGGDDRRVFLIPVGDELEKQVGFAAVDGQIAHLIDHHQARGLEAARSIYGADQVHVRGWHLVLDAHCRIDR